jgi:NAD(P)-dependent dehydrogenase (short-subunit alcohol dehydrogenase family)
MSISQQFIGKVVVITGAGSGIGRATALAFADQGAKVVVVDIVPESGQETVHLIQEKKMEALFVQCDVAHAEEVESMIAKTVGIYGKLDYICNNASIEGVTSSIIDYPEGTWDQVINVNLKGPWLCMKYAIPEMLKQGTGAIVNIASVVGIVGTPTLSAYAAAKHGLIGLTQCVALEYATQGIRVNAICPSFVETPRIMERNFALSVNPALYAQLAATVPMKRLAQPEEIATTALWLCSDAASFVTGHALMVDGGYTAQ